MKHNGLFSQSISGCSNLSCRAWSCSLLTTVLSLCLIRTVLNYHLEAVRTVVSSSSSFILNNQSHCSSFQDSNLQRPSLFHSAQRLFFFFFKSLHQSFCGLHTFSFSSLFILWSLYLGTVSVYSHFLELYICCTEAVVCISYNGLQDLFCRTSFYIV